MLYTVSFLLLVLLCLVAGSIGIFGNILILVIILKDKNLRKNTANHFIVAITFTDFLLASLPIIRAFVS
jgi:hypothetical protein